MRLIDADALLEKVQFRNPVDNHNAEIIAGCVKLTRRIIDNCPTIDAIPVVRCRNCVLQAGCKVAQRLGDDGFCSYGERKEADRDV